MSVDVATVRVSFDGDVREGRAVDLSDRQLSARTVARAIRTGSNGSESDAGSLRVTCPEPTRVHEHVGCVTRSTSVRVRTALAAAARTRGLAAPQDEDVRELRDRLDDAEEPSPPDLADARRRLAGTAAAVERLRERVATLRGRVQAGREAGRDVSDLESDLADATRELSERETERTAAREALDRARRAARESRDARERRRRLQDRLGNLERDARSHLVDAVREEFAAAVAAAPSPPADEGPESPPDPFAVDDVTAALAVGRVAALRAPVVLACDRFESPASAVEWFDAPVIRVSRSRSR